MARLDVVGCLPSKLLGLQRDMFEKWSGPDGDLWVERIALTLQGKNPLEAMVRGATWADEIVAQARRKLKKFFGRRAQISPIPAFWTPEFLGNAAKYNLLPVFLPEADISESFQHRGYVKPEAWYYNSVKFGNIKGEAPTKLSKGWYLADFSIGTDYANGTQVFPNDPLAPIIERLRREKKVGKYDQTPLGSRFAITDDEWRNVVLSELAKELGLQPKQVRLERAIEFSAIGNFYDSNRGKFNMWEWFDDVFENLRRLCGGHRGYGGLASVDYHYSGARYDNFAARPLVSFV